jgi:hypothetical protein
MSTVSRLHHDLQKLRSFTAKEKKAVADLKKAGTKEKAQLATIANKQQAIVDQFMAPNAQLDVAKEVNLLKQMFALGQKEVQTRDAFEHTKAHDKSLIAKDKRGMKAERKVALKHLKPAEYKMSLKDTNRVRKELGLKAVKKAFRKATASGAAGKVLATARRFLGTHEGAGNSNPFSRALGRPPEAWCADFVSYCAKKAGLKLNTASAQGVASYLQSRGTWKGRHDPKPGDALTFNWSGSHGWADHVGMVEKVFMRGGQKWVQTIEGNSGDMVRRKQYPANSSLINGYGRIV